MIVVLILAVLAIFVFFKFYTIQNGKIISNAYYNKVILDDELTKSAQSGDVEKQIQIAEQMVRVKNDNQAKIDLANAYLEKASLEFKEVEFGNKALDLVNQVIASDQNNFQAFLTAGYAYEVLQDYPSSLEQYNKAIELNPNYDISYVKRGHAYDLSGDLKSAEADYTKAYQINNQNDTALMNLARIAQRKGDFVEAKKYAQLAIGVSKIAYVKATAYEIIGLSEIDSDNYKLAIDDFSKSIDAYANYVNAYSNRAYAKILLNDYVVKDTATKNEIEQDLNTALSMYNKDSFANVVYGLLMEAVGDKTEASVYYKKALDLVDQDITLGASEKVDMKNKINQSITNLRNNK